MAFGTRNLIIILAVMFGGFGLLFMFVGFAILGESAVIREMVSYLRVLVALLQR